MAKEKVGYDVFENGIFVGRTWAVSERQAINNVVYRRCGEVPTDRRPTMTAVMVRVIESSKLPPHISKPKPRQLYFPGL